MAKELSMLRYLVFVLVFVTPLLDGVPAVAAHPPDLSIQQPTETVLDDHNHADDMRLGHNYIVSGLALRGPLNEVCEKIVDMENDRDGKIPSLSISYVSKSLGGETSAITMKSIAELKDFLRVRRDTRRALAEEIMNMGVVSLAGEYSVYSKNCNATGLQEETAQARMLGLDYRLSLGNTEAIAVSFSDVFLVLTQGENPIMLFGHVNDGFIEIEQIGGACSLKLAPVQGSDWTY